MNKMHKIFILHINLTLLALLLLVGCKSESDYNVEADITFGYDGVVKISSKNPLNVTIHNKGKAFEGEVQIEINDSRYSKIIFAQEFQIAENASKEINMNVPVYLIQKDFNVTITTNEKSIYEENVNIREILPPNIKTMAVITNYPDEYRFLNNLQISNPYDKGYEEKMKIAAAAGEKIDVEGLEKIRTFYFEDLKNLNAEEKLEYFDYIYLDNDQSLNIDNDLEEYLNNWMEKNNALIIETGANYKKLYNSLPTNLKPYNINNIETNEVDEIWKDLSLNNTIDIAVGDALNIDNTISYVKYNELTLGLVKKIGSGGIITLSIDFSNEPLASWASREILLEYILKESININNEYYDNDYYNNYNYLLDRLPTEKEPPYVFMIILFSVYIVVIGPIIYLILKKIDKRDYAWFIIPIGSIICVIILYIFGFNTRFNKPIINSISIIEYEEGNDFMNIDTNMAIFNNKKGKLSIEWDKSENININYSENRYYGYYEDDQQLIKRLRAKIIDGATNKYEIYEASLWNSNIVKASKLIPYSEKPAIKVNLNGEQLKIDVTNNTFLLLKDAFVKWGETYVYLGDLKPEESKSTSINIKDGIYFDVSDFFIETFGDPYKYNSRIPTNEERELRRKFDLLMETLSYNRTYRYQSLEDTADFDDVQLIALNYQDIGYDLKVNEDTTENYNSNIVKINTSIDFEKGSHIKVPEGMIKPNIIYSYDESFTHYGSYDYERYDNTVRLYETGIAELTWEIPSQFELNSGTINIGNIYGEKEFYNSINGQDAEALEGTKITIYNVKSDEWEEVTNIININDEIIDNEEKIRVRIDIREVEDKDEYVKIMDMPTITFEGSVK